MNEPIRERGRSLFRRSLGAFGLHLRYAAHTGRLEWLKLRLNTLECQSRRAVVFGRALLSLNNQQMLDWGNIMASDGGRSIYS